MSTLKIPTAKIFAPLLKPARYKGVYGGRGSGKSHFFGELLVETCQAERGTLAVCIREAQRTLAQSSKRLIEGKIASLGLGHGFKLFSDKIETPGDGLIIFRGLSGSHGGLDQITGRISHRLDRRGAGLKRAQPGAAAADDPRQKFRAVGQLESAPQERCDRRFPAHPSARRGAGGESQLARQSLVSGGA